MDRREFFKLAGIGTIAIAGAPTLFVTPRKDKKIERFNYTITDLADDIKQNDIVRYMSETTNEWEYVFVYAEKLIPMKKYAPIMKLSINEIKSVERLYTALESDMNPDDVDPKKYKS